MTKIEIRRMVSAAVAACEEKKAERISILELDPSDSGFTDYFLICSGTNERQNQAIASGIQDVMKRDFDTLANSVEGYRQGEWILLDYVDFVVHIFSNEKRDFYDIERLRKTATKVGLDELTASLAKRVSAVRKKQAAKTATRKKSPDGKPAAKKSAVKKQKPALKKALSRTTPKKAGKAPVRKSNSTAARKAAKKRPAG